MWERKGEKERTRRENNERESQLNETRAIVRVHFSIIIFTPYFYFKREYGFNLTSSRFVVIPPCELVSRISFCLPCAKKSWQAAQRGHEGHKKETNGRKIITTRSLYKRFLFPPKAVGTLPIFIPDILFLLDNPFIIVSHRSISMNFSIPSFDPSINWERKRKKYLDFFRWFIVRNAKNCV